MMRAPHPAHDLTFVLLLLLLLLLFDDIVVLIASLFADVVIGDVPFTVPDALEVACGCCSAACDWTASPEVTFEFPEASIPVTVLLPLVVSTAKENDKGQTSDRVLQISKDKHEAESLA